MHCTVLLVGQWGCRIHQLGGSSRRVCQGVSEWRSHVEDGWEQGQHQGLKSPGSRRYLWSGFSIHGITCHHAGREGEGGVGPPAPEILVWQVWDGANTFACLTNSQVVPRLLALLIDTFLQGSLVTLQDYDRKQGPHAFYGQCDSLFQLIPEMHRVSCGARTLRNQRQGSSLSVISLPQAKVWFKYIHSFLSPSLN